MHCILGYIDQTMYCFFKARCKASGEIAALKKLNDGLLTGIVVSVKHSASYFPIEISMSRLPNVYRTAFDL